MMTAIRIAVIGVGKIGLRHLQALKNIDRKTILQIVDPSSDALAKVKDEFSQNNGGNIVKIEYFQDLSLLSELLDLVIITTTSKVRKTVIFELLKIKRVKYLILEKFLFQKEDDYFAVEELLKINKVKTWVNCPLRMTPFYQELKVLLTGAISIDYQVSYSNLGIGTNAIHHLDIFSYLINETTVTVDTSQLDREIITSKRPGFIEFTGTLTGKTAGDHRLIITSYPQGNVPPFVQINSDKVRCLLKVNERKAWIAKANSNWIWLEIPYRHFFQSELTHIAVQQILDTETSDLTPYSLSQKLHLNLLSAFINHIQKNTQEEVISCPIT